MHSWPSLRTQWVLVHQLESRDADDLRLPEIYLPVAFNPPDDLQLLTYFEISLYRGSYP